MHPLQTATPVSQVPQSVRGPLERVAFIVVEFALALVVFVAAYLLVRVVLVALTNRVLPGHDRIEQVRLAAKVVAFAFALVVGAMPLGISIPSLGGLTVLAAAGPFVFALALGTIGLERALASRGLA